MPNDLLHLWTNFFVAELGASATLTGLLFVAVSINLSRILQLPNLPLRAAEALLSLVSVLFVTTLVLIPQERIESYGIEILITALLTWIFNTVSLIRCRKFDRQYVSLWFRFPLNQLPPLPFIIAGALLIGGHLSGLYWIAPGVLLSFAAGIMGAWILLVEIQR
jgi:hypothetical protein